MATISVDLEVCIRAGKCHFFHPALFREGEEGLPVLLSARIGPEQLADAREAAAECPSGAIAIVDDDDA